MTAQVAPKIENDDSIVIPIRRKGMVQKYDICQTIQIGSTMFRDHVRALRDSDADFDKRYTKWNRKKYIPTIVAKAIIHEIVGEEANIVFQQET